MRHMSSFVTTLLCSYLELPCHCACEVTADFDVHKFKILVLLGILMSPCMFMPISNPMHTGRWTALQSYDKYQMYLRN